VTVIGVIKWRGRAIAFAIELIEIGIAAFTCALLEIKVAGRW
jgi:hypothetical protein